MPEAVTVQSGEAVTWTADATYSKGDVIQLPNGEPGVILQDVTSGNPVGVERTPGTVFGCTKTASQVWLAGAPVWWDHSANAATCVPQYADRDFYLGTALGDVASAATVGSVQLGRKPEYIVDIHGVPGGGGGDTAVVLTAGTPTLVNRGGMLEAAYSATAEAQKLDWLSRRSFPVSSNWILEATLEVSVAPDDAAVDLDIGVASATHATDFETVAEFAAFHLDGGDNNVDVHSDDGTTDTAPADTTTDWATGTPLHLVIDGRDHTAIKFYINGVDRTPAGTYTLTAATGPLRAIFHTEKTSNDSPGTFQVDALRVRIQQ